MPAYGVWNILYGDPAYNLPSVHQWEARQQVANAVKNGTLKRLPCEVCGEEKSEAHHEDHYKPLDVNWLCRVHHMQRDFMKD